MAVENADHPCRLGSDVFVASVGSSYCGVTASGMLLNEDSAEVAVEAYKSGRNVCSGSSKGGEHE